MLKHRKYNIGSRSHSFSPKILFSIAILAFISLQIIIPLGSQNNIILNNFNDDKPLFILDDSLGSSYQTILNGIGDNLTLTLFCENNGSESSISDSDDFNVSVPSEIAWGTESINLTFSNIYAPNVTQVVEDAYSGPGQLGLSPIYAESFRVNTTCYLLNVTVYMQPQGDNPDGDDILIRVFNATNNGGIPQPYGTPSSGYLHQQTQELTEGVIFVYLTFTFPELLLNISNTYDNTFFIMFSRLGAITPSNIQWKLYPDPPGGGNDGVDEAQVYGGGASWDSSPTAIDFDMKVALAPPNASNTPKPTQIGLKVNGTPVNDLDFGSGSWNSLNRYTSDTGNILMNVQSNWTITCDVNWNSIYNKSMEITPQFFAQKNSNITWHLNWTNNFPSGFSGDAINVVLPNVWVPLDVYNRTILPEVLYSDWTWSSSSRVLRIENLTDASNDWFVKITAPNFAGSITLEEYFGGSYTLISDNLFNITDIVHINMTIKDSIGNPVNGGKGNLTIYNPSQVANYTDHNPPNSTTAITGMLSFTNWPIADSTHANGTYLIRVVWYNGTHVGLNETSIQIIYPTNLTTYVDTVEYTTPSIVNRYIGDLVNVSVFFNNTFNPLTGGISTTQAYYKIINASSGLWVDWTSLDREILGTGWYNHTFNTNSWIDGTYFILLSLNKTDYLSQTVNITIVLQKRPTAIITYLPQQIGNFISIYSNQTVEITAYFNDTYHNVGLPNALVNLTVLYNDTMFAMLDASTGNYTWTFDGAEWGSKVTLPYNFTIIVNGTRWDATYSETSLTIQILNDPPVISTIFSNHTTTMYRDQTIWAKYKRKLE